MTYKIGTRVKKVGGKSEIGSTGVVVAGPNAVGKMPYGEYDICVRFDNPWTSETGNKFPSDTVATTRSGDWTPITPDGHRAGVKGECSLLDELLSREVKNEAV